MNGIDVSNYQASLNVGAVPCDFVIAKATEGTGYVSPSCARQVDGALAAGKLAGVYHYVTGVDAAAEADFVICLYNPSSHKRRDYLKRACELALRFASPSV